MADDAEPWPGATPSMGRLRAMARQLNVAWRNDRYAFEELMETLRRLSDEDWDRLWAMNVTAHRTKVNR